jgi:Chaperone of endosialidase
MKFLSQINVNTEYTLPIVDGTNGQVLATDGNGTAYWGSVSAGVTNLDGLTDVILTSPSSGQLLRYGIPPGSGEAQPVWYNFTPNYLTPSSSIDNLGDVTITTATTGQILQWNGTAWVNATLSTVDYVSKVQHLVKCGVAVTKGQAVYVTSADGTNMIVGLASNATEGESSKVIGIAASNGAINDQIFVVTEGLVAGLNTSTATAGDAVWLGTNGNLIFGLLNKPVAPANLVYLGVVTRVQQNNGEIFVNVQNGFELKELHDVLINGVSTGQLLRRDSDGLWKNWTPNYLTSLPVHNHDDRYYTENEIAAFFGGETPIAGYNATNWDTAYGWGNHALAGYATQSWVGLNYYNEGEIDDFFSGAEAISGYNKSNWDTAYNDKISSASFSTSTGVLTLTQQDTGTITVDLDGRYLESLPSHTHAASDITSGTLSTDRLPKQELGISIQGNFGQWQAHTAYNNLNTDVAYWGWNFVQGNTNAPHSISSQWYRGRFSLGDEYGLGTNPGDYWMEIAIPRYNQGSNSGNLFVRTCENGTINGWQGVRAAFATDADTLDGQHGSYYQPASTAITTSNIGSQSVAYATSSTRLYASDSPYTYGNTNPYYLYMNYDGGSYWELKVSPATPGTVKVAYANSSGNADTLDGYHETSFIRLAANSNSPTNGVFAIGSSAGRNFIQSHSGQPLDINPLGNLVYIGAQVTVTGAVFATGGNSNQWNTAYGWGNHADAPYWNVSLNQDVQVEAQNVTFAGNVIIQGTLTESSSIRFKENIQPLEPALSKVEQLNPVTYTKIASQEKEIGLIAEEVAELFPEVVTYNEEGLVSGVQYQRLSVILLKAMQEQNAVIAALTERVNKLENK